MDIEYLLALQNLRGSLDFLSPVMSFLSKLAVSYWPVVIVAMIYWSLDRRAGKRILGGFGFGLLANGFLKLTFCVYRPWIRDARIEPYGDAKVAATGYSFPSGHSTWATTVYGGIAAWQRKKHRWVTVCLIVLILVTLLSRNWLGVHTPQDVLVGALSSIVMMVLVNIVENWTDKNIKRDWIVAAAAILLCVGLVLYYYLKSYPLTYLEDGSLLVDPAKMRADSFEGIGFVSAFCVCRCFERRGFQFEKEVSWKNRFIIGAVASVPLAIWCTYCVSWIQAIANRDVAKFMYFAVAVVYIMIIVPNLMKHIHLPKKLGKK